MRGILLLVLLLITNITFATVKKCNDCTTDLPMTGKNHHKVEAVVKKVMQPAAKPSKLGKARFRRDDLIRFCPTLGTTDNLKHVENVLDNMIKNSNITRKEFINDYFFRLSCTGSDPLTYAMMVNWKIAKKLYDYGINFEHLIEDDYGRTTTMKDFALNEYKTSKGGVRTKWMTVLKFVKREKIKGCKELNLKCTAPYSH